MTRSAPAGPLRIGVLGWRALPRPDAPALSRGGALSAYATDFDVVEVNATFYRTPTAQTFARWAEGTPPGFRFALQLPEVVCRQLHFGLAEEPLRRFLAAAEPLGAKFALVVVHLPAHLVFDAGGQRALTALRASLPVQLVCEPHDLSWQTPAADQFLALSRIPRIGVLEGPALRGVGPGGWPGLEYVRLRKLPRDEDPAVLARLRAAAAGAGDRWWIFEREAGHLASALAAWSGADDAPPPRTRRVS